MSSPTLPRLLVFRLGCAQLILWGTTFYLPGAFGNSIAEDLGWSGQQVFSGLSVALLVMGTVSPVISWLIQRLGARQVLQLGSLLSALGCCVLAVCERPSIWLPGWAVLGIGMRLSLYDALFAALAGLIGARSRPLMVQITLLGGLASAVFWPLGHALLDALGWRSAVAVYACFALLGGLLMSGLPDAPVLVLKNDHEAPEPDVTTGWLPQLGYALGMTLIGFMSAGLSAHLPALLTGLGVPVAWVALWGIGQTCARLMSRLLGQGLPALRLNVWVGAGLVLCFVMALYSQGVAVVACLFIFFYGAMNGLGTLLRASLPFELFAHHHYARLQGRLLAPGFVLSAAAPWFYAWVQQVAGDRGLLWLSLGISCIAFSMALMLQRHCRVRRAVPI
ncbi:Predicted arabinose efflux permease, MFS family [Pseudomonas asturiensis]|uniref:Predicted arabinose efflux permease, MFS family n=1 Tax=Pseudomonas asturiensis TaxID=1190415 RepID=A0A1M7KYP0_9PSED|nr:MFS transporter [Pseudomonas asturiensis]SHM70678.1 Predicted arabinose efflux permease, MFS family [Pseudomonas asturiensis]